MQEEHLEKKRKCRRGCKAHPGVIDGNIPKCFIRSYASLHDSHGAIPLAQMSAMHVVNIYDLANVAFAATEIHKVFRSLGHVPVFYRNGRSGGLQIESDPLRRDATGKAAP